MSAGIEVAKAFVTIIPEMSGIQGKIADGLTKEATKAGDQAGKAVGDKIADGAAKGGEEGGSKAGRGLQRGAASASDAISRSVRGKIGSAFSDVGTSISARFESVGSSIGTTFSRLGSSIADSSLGQGVQGAIAKAASGVEGAFGAVSGRVSGALTSVVGTVRGVGGAVGSALSGVASQVGGALEPMATRVSGAFSGLSERVSPALSGIGERASAVFRGIGLAAAAGAAAAGVAVVGIGKQALDAYSSYEQLSGGVAKLYGNAGQSVEEYAAAQGKAVGEVISEWQRNEGAQRTVMESAAKAYQTAGMSANQYMEQATTFSASLINSLGGDTQRAAEVTDVAMRAMSDNVNTFGSNAEDVSNAFNGFSKQNYTMLDNLKLGYGGTHAEMERLIADANAWGAANGEASNLSIDSFADVVQAIQQIQEKQGIAGTTEREASKTIEGSVNAARAAWENFVAGMGSDDSDMAALTENLVDSVATAAGNVVPRIAQIGGTMVSALPGLLSRLGSRLAEALPGVVSDAWEAASRALSGAGIQLPPIDAGQVAGAMSQVMEVLSGAVGKVQEMLSGLVGGFAQTFGSPEAQEGVRRLMEALSPLVDDVLFPLADLLAKYVLPAVGQLAGFVAGTLVGALSVVVPVVAAIASGLVALVGALLRIPEAAGSSWQSLQDGATGAIGAVQGLLGSVPGAVAGALASVPQAFADAFGAATEPARRAADAIGEAVSGLPGRIRDWLSSIPQAFADMFSQVHVPTLHVEGGFSLDPANFRLPEIKFYATGGYVASPTLAMVGERGGELVWPSYGGYLDRYARAIAERMPAGSGGTTINMGGVVVRETADVRRIMEEMELRVGRAERAGAHG